MEPCDIVHDDEAFELHMMNFKEGLTTKDVTYRVDADDVYRCF